MQAEYSVSLSVEQETGRLLSVYFGVRSGKSSKTTELVDGRVMADYDRRGKLLGVELIAPCTAKVLDQIEIDEPVRAFVKNMIPRQFIKGHLPRLTSLIS